jgi:hypothetical protein
MNPLVVSSLANALGGGATTGAAAAEQPGQSGLKNLFNKGLLAGLFSQPEIQDIETYAPEKSDNTIIYALMFVLVSVVLASLLIAKK